jgi:hypothetical protein
MKAPAHWNSGRERFRSKPLKQVNTNARSGSPLSPMVSARLFDHRDVGLVLKQAPASSSPTSSPNLVNRKPGEKSQLRAPTKEQTLIEGQAFGYVPQSSLG